MQRIIFRKGLDSQLPNTILDVGTPGWITDKRILVVGDGSTSPPHIVTTKSTGDFNFFNLDSLGMPGGLTFNSKFPGALGPITPARMVNAPGLLAYRGSDSNGQDTWGNVTVGSTDNTITVTNGNGASSTLDLKINPDSEVLKNLVKNTTVNITKIEGLQKSLIYYGEDTEVTDSVIVPTTIPTMETLSVGTVISVKIKGTLQTNGALMSIIGFGPKPILRYNRDPIIAKDLVDGRIYQFVYDGANWCLMSMVPSDIPAVTSTYWRLDTPVVQLPSNVLTVLGNYSNSFSTVNTGTLVNKATGIVTIGPDDAGTYVLTGTNAIDGATLEETMFIVRVPAGVDMSNLDLAGYNDYLIAANRSVSEPASDSNDKSTTATIRLSPGDRVYILYSQISPGSIPRNTFPTTLGHFGGVRIGGL